MGKYGSGAAMKEVIRVEFERVENILNTVEIPEKEKQDILDIVKEFAYQWCSSNAAACAIESAYKRLHPNDEDMHSLCQEVLSNGIREQVFNTTYPFS
jgi:hypothetical protein